DSVYSTAPDFFSLDVAGETEAEAEDPLLEPVTPVEPKSPAIEHEPTLEGGWFRGNCKFRSPMLQLH
ncbi:nucleotidyltransferase family protein, partial [Trifolium medium]|nr:nucleotidyltransferase family protein [Trifolium medium]